jgi:hypothetical protein
MAADVSTPQDTGVIADSGAADVEAAPGDGACPPPPTGAFTEATHGPLPTVSYYGGGVLTAPQIITFTFPTTQNVAALQAFGQTITQSSWFATVTADYCIPGDGGCITAGPTGLSVELTTAANPTYVDLFGQGMITGGTDLEAFVNQQIAAAVAANTIPAPTPNSLYTFYFPEGTTIWIGPVNSGSESCKAFSGYHNGMTYTDGTTPIRYAILPDCGSGNARDLTNITVAASHEIAEATTDPDPEQTLSWYLDLPMVADAGITTTQYQDDPWTNMLYYEVADNCESIPLDRWTFDDGGTTVQRIWSISAAAAGHNPCIPVPAGETYYNASTDKAIYVANVGDTFTVDISAFSDVSRPAWAIEAVDDTPTQMTMGGSSTTPLAYLQFQFVNGTTNSSGTAEVACMNNGSTAQLKVTLLADPDNDGTLGSAANQEWPEAVGVIYSVDHANPQTRTGRDGGVVTSYPYQFWPFTVVSPTTAAANGIPTTGVADYRKLQALRASRGPMAPRPAAAMLPRHRTPQ